MIKSQKGRMYVSIYSHTFTFHRDYNSCDQDTRFIESVIKLFVTGSSEEAIEGMSVKNLMCIYLPSSLHHVNRFQVNPF